MVTFDRNFDRMVTDMGRNCDACRRRAMEIGNAHSSLARLARLTSRNPTPKNIAKVKTAKLELQEVREKADEHLRYNDHEDRVDDEWAPRIRTVKGDPLKEDFRPPDLGKLPDPERLLS